MKKILVVEDDKVLNKTLTYNLKSAGYMVDSVMTVSDALSHSQQKEYELLVLDINLPDGSVNCIGYVPVCSCNDAFISKKTGCFYN